MPNDETKELVKKKLTQIYRYIQALDQLRNPVRKNINEQQWMMWFHDLPVHPTVRRSQVHIAVENDDSEIVQSGESYVLKVRRPELKQAPQPPAKIAKWLKNGWQGINGTVEVYEALEETNREGQYQTIGFQDDPSRTKLLEIWTASRDKWVESEKPAYHANAIFEKLYRLYARFERESEKVELVLGDGLLNWLHSGGGDVYHPILLQRLSLQFDPLVPEFTFIEADQSTELYTALLRSIPDVSGAAINHCREDMEAGGWHPLEEEGTSEYLKKVAAWLSPTRGRFIGHGSPKGERNVPIIGRDPVIFSRDRILGFSAAIESVLKDLPISESQPAFLKNIVGIEVQTRDTDEEVQPVDLNPNGEDEDILLSKEANSEQVQIARSLEKHGAVLVQGPPGTGKTHTIANLLGHFLAQGKGVLVTSHAAKALKVLQEKVVEPLQPLCVSLMRDDSRSQMEKAINAVTERLANSDLNTLEQSASSLYYERLELLLKLREARQELLLARTDEYRPVVIAGEECSPSQAARQVAKGEDNESWIPLPVTPGAPMPLSPGELAELYSTNVMLTSEDERELAYGLPDPERLLLPDEFTHLVSERSRLLTENLDYRRDLWVELPEPVTPDAIQDLLNSMIYSVSPLQEGPEWRLAAIAAGKNGGVHREPWDTLVDHVKEYYETALHSKEILLQFDPSVSDDCLPGRIEQVIDDIIQHLELKGKLGPLKLFFNREWKTLCRHARVNQHSPKESTHFKALRTLVCVKGNRKKLIERWERQVTILGGPGTEELGPEPEHACHQLCSLIKQSLDWYTSRWAALENNLVQFGFCWDAFLDEIPPNLSPFGELLRLRDAVLEKLPVVIEAHTNRLAFDNIEVRLRNLSGLLEMSGGKTTAGLLQQLISSVKTLESGQYDESFRQLVDLHAKRELLKRRRDLLARLEKAASSWAMAIRDRRGRHSEQEVPGDAQAAWLWRQFHDELEKRANKSMEELQGNIIQLSENLRSVTASLVEKKAWIAQIQRTSLEQQQALHGWKLLMKRVGKGTGTRVPRLLAEARKLMPVCQTAVPVWIMPLSRVAENFQPGRNFFDVVIIDEASQADVMALVALYMGRQVIVVGDNEQVSPLAVGQRQDEVQKLIDEYLSGIPNSQLYDGLFSIYELGMTAFKPVCLREHFRSVSPIIQFSNHLSYDGKIKPLRDDSDVLCRPYTVVYRVEGAALRNGKVNEKEALTIASLLVACTEQPEYEDADFGVISMLGEEQAVLIDNKLQRYLPSSEYSRRRIQCGNSAQFQGDERDIIFLSIVDAAYGEGTLRMLSAGNQDMYKKRFNVAASRARNQMWVVYSLDPEINLQPGDLRRRLIQHAKDPHALMQLLDRQEKPTESEFERLVVRRLTQAGYRVKAQWAVSAYRIDMVVEGGGKRLAIECDGDRYHTPENLREDMARQMILERMGWRFVRIRGGQFFRNPEKAMEPVFERLKALEIPPEGPGAEINTAESIATELKDRIIRRAVEISQEWGESWEGFAAGPSHKVLFRKQNSLHNRGSDKLNGNTAKAATESAKTGGDKNGRDIASDSTIESKRGSTQ